MRPFTIVSLWDVIELESANLLAANSFLAATIKNWELRGRVPSLLPMGETERVWVLKHIERLRDCAKELEMVGGYAAASRAFDACLDKLAVPNGVFHLSDIREMSEVIERLLIVFNDEMRSRLAMVLPLKSVELYRSPEGIFGEAVADAFPSASADVGEAGRCFALGRYTASVFHCMRMLETGLSALAKELGVPMEANWNTILGQIEKEIRVRTKATHGEEWRDDEPFFTEAATHFRMIKNAWRNHAMHTRDFYDEERARAIYDSTVAFMKHLAGRLAE